MKAAAVRVLAFSALLAGALASALFLAGVWHRQELILLELLLLFLLFLVLWLLPLGAALLLLDRAHPPEQRQKFYRYYARRIAGFILFFSRVDLRVSGLEKLPDGNFLLVGNHRSALDPVVEMGILLDRNLGFVAKQELFRLPVLGRLLLSLQCLPLNRGVLREEVRTILRAARLLREQKASIGIYPEGTRNTGEGLLPFRNGAFRIAERAEAPIVVSVIRGSDEVRRNFPFRSTRVCLEFLGVLDRDFVTSHHSSETGEAVRAMMEAALCRRAVRPEP